MEHHNIGNEELRRCFPYEPYAIQLQFMQQLCSCIDDSVSGLFESPTGTGKTLSIISGLVAWLIRARKAVPAAPLQSASAQEQGSASAAGHAEPDWLDDDHDETTGVTSDNARSTSQATAVSQVIYAARTHSQLSQFMGEFKKVPSAKDFSIVAVASRKVLCIHPKVNTLSSSWRINDRCLQLQSKTDTKKQVLTDGSTQSSGGCGFRCRGEPALNSFVDAIVSGMMDIEELAGAGSRRAVCPYYASRDSIARADFVLVPYACLIHKDTRDSLGLDLTGKIVIIDEAHNLLPAINSSHSLAISSRSLKQISVLLSAYLNHYQTRLGPAKAAAVTAVKGVADRMKTFLQQSPASGGGDRVMTPNDFLLECKLGNINVPHLLEQQHEGHLVFKIAGFADTLAKGDPQAGLGLAQAIMARQHGPGAKPAVGPQDDSPEGMRGRAAAAATFQSFVQLLKELSSANQAGRVLIRATEAAVEIKYVLLDASSKFAGTLRRARSVVLASGTLAPIELLTRQLFAGTDPARLRVFQCGHVVAPERVLALGLGAGPRGRAIRLTHGARDAAEVLDECGLVLSNLCRIVPQGLVAFVPSFAYLDKLRQRWHETGLEAQLKSKKAVFFEARDVAACDSTLKAYRAHVLSAPAAGALLVCVVGAKLSEGINFGDALGRCVVAFGLPYPDARDPELRERLAYIERLHTGGAAPRCAGAQHELGPIGREMYSNMCMQAVNQCVGRAIRHVGDYAAVVLVDVRYTSADAGAKAVVGKLPGWLTQRWRDCPRSFGQGVQALVAFYKSVSTL